MSGEVHPALQAALDQLNNAVASLPLSLRKEAPEPPPPPDNGGGGAGVSKVLGNALTQIARSNALIQKGLTSLLMKQRQVERSQSVRIAQLRKIRTLRAAAIAKATQDKAIQRRIDVAVAKATGRPVRRFAASVAKLGVARPVVKTIASVAATRKQEAETPEEEAKEQEEELAKLAKEMPSLFAKMSEEEKAAFAERMAAAKMKKQGEDEEDEEDKEEMPMMKEEDEEIPEELVKLLEASGVAPLTKGAKPLSPVQQAQILKKFGFHPMPVTKALPIDSRSSISVGGDVLVGDVQRKLAGMSYSQINELRTKLGAWG